MFKHASNSETESRVFLPLPCLPLPFPLEAAAMTGDSGGGSSSLLIAGVSGTYGSQN